MKLLGPVRLFVTPWITPTRFLHPWDFPGKSTGVGGHVLLQGIFQTQGSDPGIKPRSPALQAEALQSEPPGKPPKKKKDNGILKVYGDLGVGATIVGLPWVHW